MTAWYKHGGVSIYVAHVLDALAALPAESVQVCITSPPYFGLRSYQTEPQIWGGSSDCDHQLAETPASKVLTGGTGSASAKQVTNAGSQYGNAPIAAEGYEVGFRTGLGYVHDREKPTTNGATCTRCGAWRGELGSEPSVEMYVAHIVEVFRAVRRVLHDTGTVFLNLGDSYSSGDARRADAYGTDDRALADSQDRGCLCGNLCDACRVAYQIGKAHSDGLPVPMPTPSPSAPSLAHTVSAPAHPPTLDWQDQDSHSVAATLDSEQTPALADGLPLDFQASTPDGCAPLLPESHSAASTQDGGCLLCGRSLPDSSQASARMAACSCGTGSHGSASGTSGRDVSASAYLDYTRTSHLGPKQLMMLPARVALALQADGWVLRSDIIWSKPNPMPESVTDRPTTAHEHLFLLSKRADYYFDQEAIREPHAYLWTERKGGSLSPNTDRNILAGRRDGTRDALPLPNPAGRNRRSVWTIPTEAYSGAKSIADYVGRDGKPYKASPDCPIHGLLENLENPRTGECDAPLDQPSPGSPGTSDDRGQVPACEPLSTDASPSDSGLWGSESEHILGSTDGYRTPSPSTCLADGLDGDDGLAPDTDHTSGQPTPLPDSLDSLALPYAPTAIDHSTQTHRTGLAPATSPAYTASAQTPDHIDGKLALPGFADLVDHTAESNTSADVSPNGFGYDPSAQKRRRTADICTCTIITQDHFATFPRKLVEPCVLAGSSARGQCPRCGAPWGRVVERERGDDAPATTPKKEALVASGQWNEPRRGQSGHPPGWRKMEPDRVTATWAPTCPHADLEPVPQVCLDPFAGSGTTLYVARHHGRRAVGIELSEEYSRLAADRLKQGTLGLELW